MAKKKKERPHNGGTQTEAAFRSYIISFLRKLSQRWRPINDVKKKARVSKGMYRCACCGKVVPVSIKMNGKRVPFVQVDHIQPVIDPAVGFVSYDEFIKRMFVEEDGLQLLCSDCHNAKTQRERDIAKERRANGGE